MNHTEIIPVTPSAPLTPAALAFDPTILAGQLAPASIDKYAQDFRAYLAYAGTPSAALDPATLARWRAHLAADTQLSPHTINRMLSAVKRLIQEAAVQGYASYETAQAFRKIAGVKHAALKARTKQHARTRIDPGSMRTLCEAPDRATLRGLRDAALLATLASSGVRVAEVASLTVGQIVPKGHSYMLSIRGKNDTAYREAPLSREAYRLMMCWLTTRPVASAWVFTSFAGRGGRATAAPLSTVGVWRIVQGYADAVGLSHIKPHDFRRFVGTQLAKQDIRKAQKALGHKRIDTTARHYVLDELEPGLTDNLY